MAKPELRPVEPEQSPDSEAEFKAAKSELHPVEPEQNLDPEAEPEAAAEAETEFEQLDEEEKEFRALRCDLPGVKGTSAAGIVTISVGKKPATNEFFRAHKKFRPLVPMVGVEVGMEQQFFAVASEMIEPLRAIGITVTNYVLYLTVTSGGALRIVPVRQASGDGEQNEYDRTREIGLLQSMDEWVRLFSDAANRCYKVYPAPVGRFGTPLFPDLKESKIFRLGFRDKGRLLDSVEHPLFTKWAARDSE